LFSTTRIVMFFIVGLRSRSACESLASSLPAPCRQHIRRGTST
jgi:hypothetical protein